MPTPKKLISLVLIDDNRMLREGIATLIRAQPGFKVLAASADVAEALTKAREARPDVILLDFGLADHDSLSLTVTVHADVPAARIIVMGLMPAQEDVRQLRASGGIRLHHERRDRSTIFLPPFGPWPGAPKILPAALTNSLFTQIVRNEARGNKARLLEEMRLTNRERQVIELLGEGLSNKEIAARIHIAVHTVKSHVHNVLEKLALRSRLEVVAFTHSRGGRPSGS